MDFDLLIIGSGPGGYKAAINAARGTARVALVEADFPGGTCLNQGCIPKKTLVYIAGLLEDIKALEGKGLRGKSTGDFSAAQTHKDEVIANIRKNFPVWLKRLGIRLLHGRAQLLGKNRVEVTTDGVPRTLTARRIILATGAQPMIHPACPPDGKRIITSREFMLVRQTLPESVLCLGGGAIGVEMAYLLHQFGSRVTVVEQGNRLLDKPAIPERASNMLERKFTRIGIDVRKGMTVQHSTLCDEGVRVTFTDGSHGLFGRVLTAIGRHPHAEDLNLSAAGVKTDADGFIDTDEYLQTSCPGIYAIGDVKRGPMTANAALHDAKIAVANALNDEQRARNYNRVPIVIDTALEIAAVGLTEDRAEEAGFEPEVARANFSASAKSLGRNDYEGFIEVVHDQETGQMLGGCIVGPEAGEQVQMLTAACQSSRGLWFFKDISYSHPSWCEELENAIDPYMADFIKAGHTVIQPGIYSIS